MAEVILNRAGQGKFRAFSAGSQPKGQVHPYALDLLRRLNYDVSGVRSKSWLEFSGPNAPKLDFAFTLCDDAAAETCPVWPGQPMTAHWGLPDPAAATGNEAEIRLAFADAFRMLNNRISISSTCRSVRSTHSRFKSSWIPSARPRTRVNRQRPLPNERSAFSTPPPPPPGGGGGEGQSHRPRKQPSSFV